MTIPVILIHAETDDPHAHAVRQHLDDLNAPACVLARDRCFVDWLVSCDGDDVIVEVRGSGTWAAQDIKAVLWRRDFIAESAWVHWEGIDVPAAKFIAEQRARHVRSAFKRLAATTPFLNDITTNDMCSSKALQHHVARRCGLTVPRTYVGSDPGRAAAFARHLWSLGLRCCTKNIESTHIEINGVKHARLTKMFAEQDLSDLSGLPACPMFFQEYVEKRFEYRVTIVGQEVFACRIDSQAAGGPTAIDWRNYNVALTPHYAAELDDRLKGKLVRLVHDLGLTFGAVDLVENPQGEFFFLEVNSMGQWLWIEDLTGLPISRSIARHLTEPSLIRREQHMVKC